MRINTNISAMNTYGRLTNANAAKSSSLAKLSSGLRINKAGDDAAGLAISEKMKGQVGGLKQAVRNAQDGVSLIQTAEGALNETHAILGRMRDLAVQGANGTLSQDDRGEINKEFNALKEEITRISDTTEFNTKKLLNTEGQSFTFQIGANDGQIMSVTIGKMNADTLGITSDVKLADIDESREEAVTDAEGDLETAKSNEKISENFTAALENVEDDTTVYDDSVSGIDLSDSDALDELFGESHGLTATSTWAEVKTAVEGLDTDVAAAESNVSKAAAAVDTAGREASSKAITSIDSAIKDVSAQRSSLGAAQNRLNHTVKNLTTTQENLSEANSRIRDVDMAEEMMEFTKNNILSQAATSMLAQANSMPNSVLGLLQ
ncbi:flagellin N-terminal helical domain-containing protein [Enterococcus olivae]